MTTISDPATTYRGFPSDELIADYRLAVVSRYLDDREIALQKQSRVFFQISGAGHEALLLGLARSLRPGYDWFFPYYRDRSLVLGLGVSPTDILLQAVGSSADPASGGRQMPCHWGSAERNIVTQSSATASQCLSAVGCAEATRYIQGRDLPGCHANGDELTYVSLGEGSTSEGEFWESLNTSCRLHLPILYVVADNGYAISVRAEDQSPAPISEMVRGFRGLAISQIDGRDYFQSRHIGARAIARVRAGEGPGLIHAKVTRPYSHSAADTQSKYRSASELEEELRHDPISQFGRELVDGGVVSEDDLERIREEAKATVAEAARAALAGPRPDPSTVLDHVYVVPDLREPLKNPAVTEHAAPGTADADADADDTADAVPVAFGESIRRALFEAMEADERIRVFGEDVADAPEEWIEQVEGKGGVFGTTHGLQRRFGVARCFNTPLAEANIIGRGVGQAIRGLRPCPEIQFFDYIWPAMTQIKTEAATIRWRSNGAFSAPMVIRVPIGGYLRGGAIWHSQSGESIFAHIPGLIVMFPSRARDAAGMLRCAFLCEDPVLFLEHKHLLRQPYTRDPFPPPEWVVPLGKGDIRREGKDLTIVSWGATVQKSIDAASQLQEQGYSAEIIDLRFISPWDHELVGESVARTGRVLVVHEDIRFIGFGAEVAAWVAEECFTDLDAPVGRVGAKGTHVAYEPTLEEAILPQVHDITSAAMELLKF